jgi:hypothetical protein
MCVLVVVSAAAVAAGGGWCGACAKISSDGEYKPTPGVALLVQIPRPVGVTLRLWTLYSTETANTRDTEITNRGITVKNAEA